MFTMYVLTSVFMSVYVCVMKLTVHVFAGIFRLYCGVNHYN